MNAKSTAGLLVVLLAGCARVDRLDEERLASTLPEVSSCAQWLGALDEEVAAAGVEDRLYARVPDFPYLRVDSFLTASRRRAAAEPAAFAVFTQRLLEHDLEARRHEIANLPPAAVEKWSAMRIDESRSLALHRSVQCGRLLRETELARPQARAALLERVEARPHDVAGESCAERARPAGGAIVRFSPPAARLARATVAQWLMRAESDPLGQPTLNEREVAAIAAAYAPSLELSVASDADRFGALRWPRDANRPEIDAAQPAVYVHSSYARYGDRALFQVLYTVWFPEDRIEWRVTLAPDGEPLAYEATATHGCRAIVLTPRARLRRASALAIARLPKLAEEERPLVAIGAQAHVLEARGVVRGADRLAHYELRRYDELRSLPALDGQSHAAAAPPVLADERADSRFVFDIREPRS
jgi:hypothetical protein